MLLLLTGAGAHAATQKKECEELYTPTPASYDFTTSVDRWGQGGERELGTGEERKVGTIYINRLPIFDPESEADEHDAYRWANRFHKSTQERVIRELLLFHEGDPLDARVIAESERILRSQRYLGDAVIREVGQCGDRLELEVVTKEVWTLVPELSLHLSGGSSKTRAGLRDANFLGTGNRVSLIQKRDIDRDSWIFHYTDVNFRGKRNLLRMHATSSSDGYERMVQVGLPFFALDSSRSWGLKIDRQRRADHQYMAGEKATGIEVTENEAEAYFGFSRGVEEGIARRFLFGLARRTTEYAETNEAPPAPWPRDMDLAYPFFQYERIEDLYAQAFNLDQMNQIEDLYLGTSVRSRIGYSPGADSALLFDGELNHTLRAETKRLLQGTLTWSGRWSLGEQRVEDGMVDLSLRYHRGQTRRRSLFAALGVSLAANPTPVNELGLGGEMGLRGYPNRYQNGDTRYLLSLEERFFTDYHFMHLAHIGYALFVDAGKAFYRNGTGGNDDTLADIGVGLRIVPSKSTKGEVIHVNIAFPLTNRGEVDRYQISAQLKKTI